MLPKHRRIASGGLGFTCIFTLFSPQFGGIFDKIAGFWGDFLLFFTLQFGSIFSRIVGGLCAVDEVTERLNGNNDPFAQFDGADFPGFDQIRHERLANVYKNRSCWDCDYCPCKMYR